MSLVLSLLSFLSNVAQPTTNVASNFLRVLLVVVAKDLQQLFCSRDPILQLAKVHAGKANAWLPSKQGLIGGVSDSSVKPCDLERLSHYYEFRQ